MTTGRFPPKCPSCGEKNEGDMQFCIFCGVTLTPPPQKAEELQQSVHPGSQSFSSLVTLPSFPAASVLVCTVCQRTDPLHGQYCVFCAGRTIPAGGEPTQLPSTGRQSVSMSHAVTDRPPPTASGEFPYAHVVHAKPRKSGKTGTNVPGTILVSILALLIGGAVGFGGIYLAKGQLEQKIADRVWPQGEYLLLFTKLPFANVLVEQHDHQSLYVGMTGKTGSLIIDRIAPGPYEVTIADGLKRIIKNVAVVAGKPTSLGYPEPVK